MKRLLLALLRFYQRHISPAYPRRCRFEPTCSDYAVQAIGKYGALKGGALTAKRLCRCHPYSKRDYYDPVPERASAAGRRPCRRNPPAAGQARSKTMIIGEHE